MHHLTEILRIIFDPSVVIVVAVAVLIGLKITRGSSKGRSRGQEDEETRMIQEMYHGMSKLEERVESLETILLDKEGKR